jgi:glucose-6-phosphate 1-epimerase
MDVAELEERFAAPGVLGFEKTASGLVAVRVTAAAAEATVYLHGAHLTDWRPAGQAPVLFLSARTELAPGKPIRGGVPVIFPWFGPRHDGKAGPQHGFARTSEWELAFAALAGEEVHLTFTLAPNEASRALGFDHFKLAYRMTIGRSLTLELVVANDPVSSDNQGAADKAGAPLLFEEALHTYFAVADVEKTTLTGLGETAYLDKRDEMRRKVQPAGAMAFTGTADRVYLDTTATCVVEDAAGKRRIVIEKSGSQTTVVWNPWAEVAATIPDMEPDGWREMLCVETVNAGDSAVRLEAGQSHAMTAKISVEDTA